MKSKCAELQRENKEVIQRNISAILSNGIHCSYLLNTMTNPAHLPYTNYSQFAGLPYVAPSSGAAEHKKIDGLSSLSALNNSTRCCDVVESPFKGTNSTTTPTSSRNTLSSSHSLSSSSTTCDLHAQTLTLPSTAQPILLNTTTTTTNMNVDNLYYFNQNSYLDASAYHPTHAHSTTTTTAAYPVYHPAELHATPASYPTLAPFVMSANSSSPHQHRYAVPAAAGNAVSVHAHHAEINLYTTPTPTPTPAPTGINHTQSVRKPPQQCSNACNNRNDNVAPVRKQATVEQDIARRKQRIFDFLTKQWDHYPSTGDVGEPSQVQVPQPLLPPGLHKQNGQPLLHSSGEGQHQQQYIAETPSYTFQGSFQDAKKLGVYANKWIMLNIHDTDLFTAQFANPLIWKHKRYGVIVKQHFILINCVKQNAMRFVKLYGIRQTLSISIINPFDDVKVFEFAPPSTSSNILSLRKEIMNLAQRYPNPTAYTHGSQASQTMAAATAAEAATKPTKPPIPHRYRSSHANAAPSSTNENQVSAAAAAPPPQPPPSMQNAAANLNTSLFAQAVNTRPVLPARPQVKQQPLRNRTNINVNVNATVVNDVRIAPAPQAAAKRRSDHYHQQHRPHMHMNAKVLAASSKAKKNRNGISSAAHIYCNHSYFSECAASTTEYRNVNVWDFPYTNLKNYAFVLSTRQSFNWQDWMNVITKCSKIIGAIPSEQHIEFLRNRNGELTLESSGTYNGWWSEQRVAEYAVNEKYGLLFEGGFACQHGRTRNKYLNTLELSRHATFKKMLIILPNFSAEDKALFHDNSLSITPYSDYDKTDNVKSFQLWLAFISHLSVEIVAASKMYKNDQFQMCDQFTNFCIKLGSKWKIPLKTLYADIEPLTREQEQEENATQTRQAPTIQNLLFSSPKIATDATAKTSGLSASGLASLSSSSINNTNSTMSSSSASLTSPPSECGGMSSTPNHSNLTHNKYHHMKKALPSELNQKYFGDGFEVHLLSKSRRNKRTRHVHSYQQLQECLSTVDKDELIDFPFPLFGSGWFSFNTLSVFATILEQHLNGTWVSMYCPNSRKQFKQYLDVNKNTRRRPMMYSKVLRQRENEQYYRHNHALLGQHLSAKNKQRLLEVWNENKLFWTDLIIDPMNPISSNLNVLLQKSNTYNEQIKHDCDEETMPMYKHHQNNKNYRKKTKQRPKRRGKRTTSCPL